MELECDSTLWTKDEKLADLHAILPNIKLLSIDIFDTLLFRACREPHDVFLETGRRAIDLGVLRHGLTPEEYKAVRIFALDSAYRSSPIEPCIEEILEQLIKVIIHLPFPHISLDSSNGPSHRYVY